MIKIAIGLIVALVVALGYSVHRIDNLNTDLGAADSECVSRIAEFERDAQRDIAEAREEALQDRERLRRRFESRLQLVSRELEARDTEIQEMQREFQRRLETENEPEVRQWLDTPMPASLLQPQ